MNSLLLSLMYCWNSRQILWFITPSIKLYIYSVHCKWNCISLDTLCESYKYYKNASELRKSSQKKLSWGIIKQPQKNSLWSFPQWIFIILYSVRKTNLPTKFFKYFFQIFNFRTFSHRNSHLKKSSPSTSHFHFL